MKKSNLQKSISTMVVLLLVVGCFTTLVNTTEAQTRNEDQTDSTDRTPINVTEPSRSTPTQDGWHPSFQGVAVDPNDENPSRWFFQYSGPKVEVTRIHLEFINTEDASRVTFDWYPHMGYSINTNSGIPIEGWIVEAPEQYMINFNERDSNDKLINYAVIEVPLDGSKGEFTVIATRGNRFFPVPEFAWGGLVAVFACFAALGMFYMSKNRRNTKLLKTSII